MAIADVGAKGDYNAVITVAQIGARGHYLVARALHQTGVLDQMYTDLWTGAAPWRFVRELPTDLQPQALRRLAQRASDDIPSAKVRSATWLGLRYWMKLRAAQNSESRSSAYLWMAKSFNEKFAKHLSRNGDGLFVFSGAGLELMQRGRELGLYLILDQISLPIAIYNNLWSLEQEKFPEWEKLTDAKQRAQHEYMERLQNEWSLANKILCASTFTRDALVETGAEAEKCVVLPYGIDNQVYALSHKENGASNDVGGRVLRVLVVGTVSLMKGAPYVFEAAKLLRGSVEFRWVGGSVLSNITMKRLSDCVELVGHVPRNEVRRHYEWADVVVFPTICDGFGFVILEALSAGCPVIATKNSAGPDVISDGEDGFVIPAGSAEAIVEGLERIRNTPGVLKEMRANAFKKGKRFSIAKYSEGLREHVIADLPGK